MAKPDASMHDPSPNYIRALVDKCGFKSHGEVAARLGISPRQLRAYVATTAESRQDAPYLVQYGLEQLAAAETADSQVSRERVSFLRLLGLLIRKAGGRLTISQRDVEMNSFHPRATIEQYADPADDAIVITLREPKG